MSSIWVRLRVCPWEILKKVAVSNILNNDILSSGRHFHSADYDAYDAITEGPAGVAVFSPLRLFFLWMAL